MMHKGSFRVPGTLDGGLSWFAVLGSFMTQFVVMGIHNVFGLLYLDLLTEFGESKATTGKLPLKVFNPLSSALALILKNRITVNSLLTDTSIRRTPL